MQRNISAAIAAMFSNNKKLICRTRRDERPTKTSRIILQEIQSKIDVVTYTTATVGPSGVPSGPERMG
jgi:hypothetical protein